MFVIIIVGENKVGYYKQQQSTLFFISIIVKYLIYVSTQFRAYHHFKALFLCLQWSMLKFRCLF